MWIGTFLVASVPILLLPVVHQKQQKKNDTFVLSASGSTTDLFVRVRDHEPGWTGGNNAAVNLGGISASGNLWMRAGNYNAYFFFTEINNYLIIGLYLH